jgi:hypothetical protein
LKLVRYLCLLDQMLESGAAGKISILDREELVFSSDGEGTASRYFYLMKIRISECVAV